MFRTEKLISENADKIDDATKAPVEEAIAEVKTALEGTDDDAVKSAVEKLNTTAAQLGQSMYAAAQASQQGSTDGDRRCRRPTVRPPTASSAADDDVVDAEIIDDDTERRIRSMSSDPGPTRATSRRRAAGRGSRPRRGPSTDHTPRPATARSQRRTPA